MSVTEAFLASQPEGPKDDSDEASLWREIEATSMLLADFVGGTHLWEALEVPICNSNFGFVTNAFATLTEQCPSGLLFCGVPLVVGGSVSLNPWPCSLCLKAGQALCHFPGYDSRRYHANFLLQQQGQMQAWNWTFPAIQSTSCWSCSHQTLPPAAALSHRCFISSCPPQRGHSRQGILVNGSIVHNIG